MIMFFNFIWSIWQKYKALQKVGCLIFISVLYVPLECCCYFSVLYGAMKGKNSRHFFCPPPPPPTPPACYLHTESRKTKREESGSHCLCIVRGRGGEEIFFLYFIYFFVLAINYAHVVRRSRYQVYFFNGKFTFLLSRILTI
jgi:hypothetical protein